MILGRFLLRLTALTAAVFAAAPALAHPHVWITTRSEIVYDSAGGLSMIRHIWTFDDMFSAYASQGLDTDKDGKLSRAELAPLAETNVSSLKAFDFFTFAASDGTAVEFGNPTDYWLEQTGATLTLHFGLPVKGKAPAEKPLKIEIYDPTYFIQFAPADRAPAALIGAPAACGLDVERLRPAEMAASGQLSEAFLGNLTNMSSFGAQFANRILVRCRR